MEIEIYDSDLEQVKLNKHLSETKTSIKNNLKLFAQEQIMINKTQPEIILKLINLLYHTQFNNILEPEEKSTIIEEIMSENFSADKDNTKTLIRTFIDLAKHKIEETFPNVARSSFFRCCC